MIFRRRERWKDRYKLIYYPAGNRFQLVDNLYGSDLPWLEDGKLKGLPEKEFIPSPDYGKRAQRGWRV